MEGIIKFLKLIEENWTLIITLIGLILGIYTKIKKYIKLSREEKINIALEQVKSSMLSLVVEAEKEYKSDTGKLKRSKVLNEIYTKYPELKTVIKQEELEKELDDLIKESLEKMKEMLENNEEFKKLIYGDKEKEED